jgi:xanthine phosphoribosyltransferase
MEDYPDIPVVQPPEALQIISASPLSRAQKLISASLITQAVITTFRYPKSHKDILTIDVSHFLSHRINTKLIGAIGEELAAQISLFTPDLVFTAPSSGNFLALATATFLPGIPDVIYAPKGLPVERHAIYQTKSHSAIHGRQVSLSIAADVIPPSSKIAICDDFLDTGRTVMELMNIASQAQARTVSAFFVIEKPFNGRSNLISMGVPNEAIVSLVKIEAMRPGKIKLAGFDYWFSMMRK